MEIRDVMPLAEYAAKVGRAKCSVTAKCRRGTLPGAVKIGRDWFIRRDAAYPDERIRHGRFVGMHSKK